ncbi:hypothetical protein [Vibrio alginolyticus]|uniref:hypothetical protein n=1 Tax=Vibrio alginolyticus TaxID=663 RepID=UPI000A40FB49|nr:hypothetical protein [Vibrio alginolyticus]
MTFLPNHPHHLFEAKCKGRTNSGDDIHFTLSQIYFDSYNPTDNTVLITILGSENVDVLYDSIELISPQDLHLLLTKHQVDTPYLTIKNRLIINATVFTKCTQHLPTYPYKEDWKPLGFISSRLWVDG